MSMSDPVYRADADEVLAEILVHAGRPHAAVTTRLLDHNLPAATSLAASYFPPNGRIAHRTPPGEDPPLEPRRLVALSEAAIE